MLSILLLSCYLGAQHLTDDAIWFDEWITYFISGTGAFESPALGNTPCAEIVGDGIPPLDTLCLAAIDNSWPPAFFLLLKAWDFISNGITFTDRILALFIGMLAVAVMYRMGKRMFSPSGGLIAAALLASSAFFVYYTHEVRGYTLYVLMPALAGYFYWLMLDSRYYNKRWLKWSFVASIALTLYTHYIGIAVVLGIGIYHVFFERSRTGIFRGARRDNSITPHRWTTILKMGINGCLFYAPWVAVLYISFLNESINKRSLDTLSLLQSTLYGFGNNLWWLVLPALIIAILNWKNRIVRFLLVWAVTILSVSLLGNLAADFLFHPRHIMGMLPALMLLLTFAILQVMKRSSMIGWSLVTVWVGVGIFLSMSDTFMNNLPRHISTVPQTAMDTIVDTANQCVSENDLLILAIDEAQDEWVHDQPIDYYLGASDIDVVQLGSLMTNDGDNPSVLLPRELYRLLIEERVQSISEARDNIWLMTLNELDVDEQQAQLTEMLTEDDFINCGFVIKSPTVNGTLYTKLGATCDIAQPCQP